MRALHAVMLNDWIVKNKESLAGPGRGTMKDVCNRATVELDFKVSTNAMAELLRDNGIETKRVSAKRAKEAAMQGEIEKLTAENMELRRTLAKVAASEYVPDDFKDFIFAGLKDEVKAAILQPAD